MHAFTFLLLSTAERQLIPTDRPSQVSQFRWDLLRMMLEHDEILALGLYDQEKRAGRIWRELHDFGVSNKAGREVVGNILRDLNVFAVPPAEWFREALPAIAAHSLDRTGYLFITPAGISELTDKELLDHPNVGRKTLDRIRAVCPFRAPAQVHICSACGGAGIVREGT